MIISEPIVYTIIMFTIIHNKYMQTFGIRIVRYSQENSSLDGTIHPLRSYPSEAESIMYYWLGMSCYQIINKNTEDIISAPILCSLYSLIVKLMHDFPLSSLFTVNVNRITSSSEQTVMFKLKLRASNIAWLLSYKTRVTCSYLDCITKLVIKPFKADE
jgi:hypothetical protein